MDIAMLSASFPGWTILGPESDGAYVMWQGDTGGFIPPHPDDFVCVVPRRDSAGWWDGCGGQPFASILDAARAAVEDHLRRKAAGPPREPTEEDVVRALVRMKA